MHDYYDLAEDERYSDNYNFKVSEYYRLLGDLDKQKEYFEKIKNKEIYSKIGGNK